MEERPSAWICYRVEAMSEIQRTLVLIKPDAVQRHLIGEIIGRYERKGLTIVAMEQRAVSKDLARKHYAEHERKSYFDELVDFLSSGPLVSLVLEGREAVSAVRAMHGKTDGAQAAPGTVRGDFGLSTRWNLVHASDSEKSAAREISLWFPEVSVHA